jgi:uncharacterized membrane protein
VVIDKPIPFYVIAIPQEQAKKLAIDQPKLWTDEEINGLNCGYVRLELVPRGIGRLLVRAPQLFYSIKPDNSVSMVIELINEGSRRLDNVEIKVDAPLHWLKQIEPELIPSLEISEEKQARLTFTPPADVTVGRYEFRIRTTSLSNNRPVTGEDKSVIVEVQGKVNLLATTAIVLFIIGVIVGIVIFGMRLSRR